MSRIFLPLMLALALALGGCSESSDEGDNPFAGLFNNFFLNNFVFQQCRRLPENEEVADTRSLVFVNGTSTEAASPDQSQFTGICVITDNS